MGRKNLKVPDDLFHALRDDKDDQQSWPHYLEEQCLHDDDGPNADDIAHDVSKRVTDDLTTQLPRKIAEELQ